MDIATRADNEAEAIIATGIKRRFPHHRLRGEEGTEHQEEASVYEWIIDPIDGTKNFSEGRPFSVSVGLWKDGQPLLGVLYFPDENTTLTAIAGEGAKLNGMPVKREAETITLHDAKVDVDVSAKGKPRREIEQFFVPLRESAAAVTQFCCSTASALRLIRGEIDTYVCGGGLTPFDLGASALILREAGCSIEGVDTPIDMSAKKIPVVAAARPELIGDIRTVLEQRRKELEAKHDYFARLAGKYRREMRLLFLGGNLTSNRLDAEKNWSNVVEHCIVQTAAAEELSKLLNLPKDRARRICSTSAIHDWRKRWEVTKQDPTAKELKMLSKVKPHDDLLNASNPDYLEQHFLGNQELSEDQELQFYLDAITKHNDIVRSGERLLEVSRAPRSGEMAKKANGQYWQKTIALAERVEDRLFSLLQPKAQTIGFPLNAKEDIPIFLKYCIEKHWKSVRDAEQTLAS